MTQQPGGSGTDLIGDFQRWLVRSSARGVGRQVSGQIRSALGRNQPTGDVWESATADPTPVEAPECAWCPLCRAARVLRESKPGRDTRVTAVSDALGTVVQDAFSVLEAALAATGRATGGDSRRPGAAGPAAKTKRPGAENASAGPAAGATPGAAEPGAAQPAAGSRDGAAEPGPVGQAAATPGAAEPGAWGQAAEATDNTAQHGTAEHGTGNGHDTAGRDPAGLTGAEHGLGDQAGAAGLGAGDEHVPEPPGGSMHEPDDRG